MLNLLTIFESWKWDNNECWMYWQYLNDNESWMFWQYLNLPSQGSSSFCAACLCLREQSCKSCRWVLSYSAFLSFDLVKVFNYEIVLIPVCMYGCIKGSEKTWKSSLEICPSPLLPRWSLNRGQRFSFNLNIARKHDFDTS